MKKILFVINTLGHAGAETALLELLRQFRDCEYEIYLFVLMEQGELVRQLPDFVHLLNKRFYSQSVLSKRGRYRMAVTVVKCFFRNGNCLKKALDIIKILIFMIKRKKIQIDKLLWRLVSEGADRFDETFDLAIAWMEGGSAYYTAEYVKAGQKKAFVHIVYDSSGYADVIDRQCWGSFDKIFAVSKEVKEHFKAFYPEYASKISIFHNIIDRDKIIRLSRTQGGFQDEYDGMRLLSVGRLTEQKAYDIAIEAMKLLKESGRRVRWYVLGEGNQRTFLEKKIAALDLKEDFLLKGAVDNPYPYYVQADIYVHASRFEGKSIAIQEAQILGCAIIASDCSGNREQIVNGTDGFLCRLTPQAVADSIVTLLENEEMRKKVGQAAQAKKIIGKQEQKQMLFELLA